MNDIFKKLKTTDKPKRGKGLSTPPKPEEAGKNVALPEHTPAVSITSPRRKYRVSTYLTDEGGQRLEKLHAQLRQSEGRKVKQAEVIEQALEELEKTLKR